MKFHISCFSECNKFFYIGTIDHTHNFIELKDNLGTKGREQEIKSKDELKQVHTLDTQMECILQGYSGYAVSRRLHYYCSNNNNTADVPNFDKLMLTNLHLFIPQKKVEKVSFKLTHCLKHVQTIVFPSN
jgi:hypothetical protein